MHVYVNVCVYAYMHDIRKEFETAAISDGLLCCFLSRVRAESAYRLGLVVLGHSPATAVGSWA